MRGLIPAAAAALLLSGCANAATPAEVDDEFTEHAKKVAERWKDSKTAKEWSSGIKLADRPLRLPEDWPERQYMDDASLMKGDFTLDTELPDDPPKTVKPSGSDTEVEVWDAREAYDILSKEDGSGGPQVTVTDVEFTTAPWFTNHGFVDLPVWKYTVDGYADPIAQVAFDVGDVSKPPGITQPDVDIPGVTPAAGLDTADGTTLAFDVSADCRSGVQPLVYETDQLILLGGVGEQDGVDCIPEYQGVKVTLEHEVGSRVILDAINGAVLRFNTVYPG